MNSLSDLNRIRVRSIHVERYRSTIGDEEILVACECPIGEDHTHRRWLETAEDAREPRPARGRHR